MLSGGEMVARALEDEGVEFIFGYPGGAVLHIYDALFKDSKIPHILVRHEQAATLAAHAWSIYTGKPGIAMVVPGPGFTNSLSGLVNAHFDNIPLVLIAGYPGLAQMDTGSLQHMDHVDMIKSYVKWHGRVLDVNRIGEYMSTAFRLRKAHQ